MRVFNAVFGILCVPLVFYTARTLKYSNQAVYLVTLMVLCGMGPKIFDLIIENSYATISRFILLDSMLLFFTATTIFSLVKFHSYRKQEFSPWWWIWLATTGVSIGCVCSVKWVGVFGMAVVGLYTLDDLWNKFGDQHIIAVCPVPTDLMIANLLPTLGGSCALSHCSADVGLHVLLLGSLLDS